MALVDVRAGDCLEVLAGMAEASVDAIVTDPPYHLTSIVRRFGAAAAAPAKRPAGGTGVYARSSTGFMGQTWDGGDIAFRRQTWAAMLRVMKPGGHLVAFNHSRTWHRMVVAIEDAGFEIRDSLMWLYGSGFPKSHDVARGIDRIAGVKGVKGASHGPGRYVPADPLARHWQGWGTALKPAFEPIVLARKPLVEGSVARQVMATGTGAVNVGGCRVPGRANTARKSGVNSLVYGRDDRANIRGSHVAGRWPANVLVDGSDQVVQRLPVDADGSVARFFYCAKAGPDDRMGSQHPTVKPQALMRWLVRLVTPPGGTVLDPFAGSGATGWAAWREGKRAILVEREEAYLGHLRLRAAALTGPSEEPPGAGMDADQRDLFAGLA